VLFASLPANCQQQATPAALADSDKPRIFVTDSNSWQTHSAVAGSNGSFAGYGSGGANPQTAEIIKTFGQRCPNVVPNNRLEVSDYIVTLEHEGGKGLLRKKDKVAVFVHKTGDSIFSESTLSVGGSVQSACGAILAHWAAHQKDLAAMPSLAAPGAVSIAAPTGVAISVPAMASLTVESSVPGADIEVDGNFVGSTPSTISVTPGQHTIAVKKKGYEDWSRSMNVAGTGVRLSAELEAKP
jgi:hypothetical protein